MPLGQRSLFIPGFVQGAIITLVCLSVCVSHLSFLRIARAVRGQFPQPRDLWKRVSVGERVGRFSSHAVSRWSRSPGCCRFRGVFRMRRDFVFFFFVFFFFERTRPASSMRPPCLIYLLATSTGVRTGFHYLISPSAPVYV